MKHNHNIRKSVVLLVSVAALVAPTAAMAYPVIGDDPTTAQSQAEGHAWYQNVLKKRLADRVKPASKPALVCQGKRICLKP
jgi:hypothetical protein